jgi:hypothetical protein
MAGRQDGQRKRAAGGRTRERKQDHDATRTRASGPLDFLAAYGVLVCRECRYACPTDEAATHLRARHRRLSATYRSGVVRAVQSLPARYRRQADLASFTLPAQPVPAIPQLDGPFPDGLKCRACPYVARQVRRIQEHCRTVHGWANPQRRGRPVQAAGGDNTLPWHMGVWCQRFFPSRLASGWFEVLAADNSRTAATMPYPPSPAPWPAPAERPEDEFLAAARWMLLQLQ